MKRGHTGLPAELVAYLTEHRVRRATVVGLDTDTCVLKVPMDLFDMNVRPDLVVDCCDSTGGLPAHLAGLAIISKNVGPQRLRERGLALSVGRTAVPPRRERRSG